MNSADQPAARWRQRAASARHEAQQPQQAAEAMAQHIPLGQLILVGHVRFVERKCAYAQGSFVEQKGGSSITEES